MLIQHKKSGTKGMFFVEQDGNILAEMVYTQPAANKMVIEHTEVSDELRGQKVGNQLVAAAVDYARKQEIRIIPLCPFANAVFKKTPEYNDVLVSWKTARQKTVFYWYVSPQDFNKESAWCWLKEISGAGFPDE